MVMVLLKMVIVMMLVKMMMVLIIYVVVVLYRTEGGQTEPVGRVRVGGVVGHSHLGVLSLNTILSIR